MAALVGHTALRNNHMDRLDRSATRDEVLAMREQLRGGAGARRHWPEHRPGLRLGRSRADTEEVKLLAEALDEFGALYTTHLRSEFAAILEAMQEAFASPCTRACRWWSHLKCAAGNWGRTKEVLFAGERRQDAARGLRLLSYSASSSTRWT